MRADDVILCVCDIWQGLTPFYSSYSISHSKWMHYQYHAIEVKKKFVTRVCEWASKKKNFFLGVLCKNNQSNSLSNLLMVLFLFLITKKVLSSQFEKNKNNTQIPNSHRNTTTFVYSFNVWVGSLFFFFCTFRINGFWFYFFFLLHKIGWYFKREITFQVR